MNFYPSRRTLLGPGPSDVHPRVLEALSRPTIGHLDPQFVDLMDRIKENLQYAFQTKNELTIPISAPGSAGMEACFVNLVEPGDKVLVAVNGVFGKRMVENVLRCGGEPIVIEESWGRPVDLNKVEEALKLNALIKVVAFVHAETSTGVLSDAKELSQLANKYDCLTIVDTVTSLAGSPLKIDEWKIDAAYSGSQKCLSCMPGISPITMSNKAIEIIKNRKTRVQSWFLDLNLVMGYWGSDQKTSYHHTAPVNSLYALHESLEILKEEGLENSWTRHERNHKLLKKGLEEMGFEFMVEEAYRTPQLNAVVLPPNLSEAMVRKNLLEKYDIEVGAGLGELTGKIWRIGLMGTSSSEKNVLLCLSAIKELIAHP